MTASLRHLAVTQTDAVATVLFDRSPVNAVDLDVIHPREGMGAFLAKRSPRFTGA